MSGGAGGIAGLGVGSGLHEDADIFLLQVHAGQHERGEPVIISGVHRGPGGNQLLHGGAVVAFDGIVQRIRCRQVPGAGC